MNSIILQGINTDDLRKLFQEVLEEQLSQVSTTQKSGKGLAYLNRFEVAKLLSISLPTLNNWSKAGIIQSYRIGNRVLYKPEEIDQAIKSVRNLKYKRG
jgi:excisionase family DNA binding protein